MSANPKPKNQPSQSALAVVNGNGGSYLALAKETNVAEILRQNIGPRGITPSDLERVRVPAGGGLSWTLTTLSGDEEIRDLQGIIIEHRDVRAYWNESFDKAGGGAPPDCTSIDGETGQGKPGGACATCPMASWGSAGDGRKGQACRSMKLLLTLLPGELLPRVVVVPPSSLSSVRKFFLRLASQGKLFCGIVTRFGLEKTKSDSGITFSRINLSLVEEIDEATAVKVKAYRDAVCPAFHAVKVGAADVTE